MEWLSANQTPGVDDATWPLTGKVGGGEPLPFHRLVEVMLSIISMQIREDNKTQRGPVFFCPLRTGRAYTLTHTFIKLRCDIYDRTQWVLFFHVSH